MIDPNEKIKILLPAHDIPLGSVVTKATGDKEYILDKNMMVYGGSKKSKEPAIKAERGTLLLLSQGYINIINDNTVLGWVTTINKLIMYYDSYQ